ncbi:hypothetical protein GJW-30_1_01323 [Variibacter gotjawalensis]|uniref:DUF4170 domain-containing protein n=1 Tax=Variibacter gotjawalensis TaxID=1333996 RepID=A0A0S3PSD8_9BRAD|nr:hypothetical protein [Variibacter gotjawalensis]NIK49106.1 hypothetical protein [Variibacter gotjawalensis]RZS50962.1 hypothetical protein EV661_3434 [Variibacter gotjawalensis]BAT58796.1 hypothetical protein GJW-30_1_01323 [Variibacter gotjawalensis]
MSQAQFWVVGGEFGSLNFHSLVQGTQQVRGPYPTRPDAEEAWKAISQEFRYKANYRFTIVQDSARSAAAA